MQIIKLNFYYKNLLLLIPTIIYFALFFNFLVPLFRKWDTQDTQEHFFTLGLAVIFLLFFPLILQFFLKAIVSITQKNQELKLTEEGLSIPEFYVRFWSLEMKKIVLIPYGAIKAIKFSELPNPLFPQKMISIIYKTKRGEEKHLGLCDNQFSGEIVDYQKAYQFLKNRTHIELNDNQPQSNL